MTAPAAGEDHERAGRSQGVNSGAMRAVTGYLRRNSSLLVGLALLFGIIAFAVIGGLFVDPQNARPLSTRPLQPPSWALPFGSDRQGRNLFAVITSGTLLTLRVGLIAGGLGVTIGAALAFVSAYYGGWVDTVLRSIVDVGLTVPNLMVLIVVAMMLRQGMTVDVMALVIASLAWLYPARTIRSQVLTLRERAYVEIARLSGNPFIVKAIESVMARLSRARWLEVWTEPSREQAWAEHRRILDSIRRNQPDEAAGLAAEHIRDTRNRLLRSLNDDRRGLRARGFAVIGTR